MKHQKSLIALTALGEVVIYYFQAIEFTKSLRRINVNKNKQIIDPLGDNTKNITSTIN